MESLKKFWRFLNEDSWQSWLVFLLLLVLIIRFIFFPLLSFVTNSPLPLVVVESCSMHHDSSFDDWWFKYGTEYDKFGLNKTDFESFPMKNGFNKGDIMVIWGRGAPKIGDVIVFAPNAGSSVVHPIIHRVVTENPYGTKGDNGLTNPQQIDGNNVEGIDETRIADNQIIGRVVFRIPFVGWIKLIFFEFTRAPQDRGFC
jgi:signal peptidase I